MMPARMTKSPKHSSGLRSLAQRPIRASSSARICGSVMFSSAGAGCGSPRGCPQVQVVATRRLAHQTYFRQHGAAAAVGATGDPEDDGVIRQAVLGQQPLDVGDEGRQHALGLGHRQGQVGRATQAMDCLRCSLTPSSSRPYWRARASMRAFSPAGTPAMMRFWLAVRRKSP